jgi:hypothetical protein
MKNFFSASFYLLFVLLICGAGCKKKPNETLRGFYYWKNDDSGYRETPAERLDTLGVQRLYVKVLDVDWSPVNGAYPRSLNSLSADAKREYVPTVFITNRVFENIEEKDLLPLAKRILSKCQAEEYIYETKETKDLVNEIQFDCDWTAKTKDLYFSFLKIVKKMTINKTISATIRLYQYKYRDKAGVPPVEKGMLMLYNLQDLRKYEIENSIFNLKEAESYLKGQASYPMPLDAALPLFSWAVGFHDNQFVALHNDVSPQQADQFEFLKKEKDHYYMVTSDTVFGNYYYRTGDHIKVEYIDSQQLNDAATLAKTVIHGDKPCLAFYHYDESILSRFTNENLIKIWNEK